MKSNRYKVMTWVGLVVLFLGLIVMLFAMIADEEMETAAGLTGLLCGLGMFLGGTVLVCVGAVLDRKQGKRVNAKLPPNAIMLFDAFTAYFLPDGLATMRNEWQNFAYADRTPYSEIKVFHTRTFTSPRAKGKDAYFMRVPDSRLFSGPVARLRTLDVPVDGKVMGLAREHGVEIVEKLQEPSDARTCRKKFTCRKNGQLGQAIFMTVAAVAVIAISIGLGVWAGLTTGASSSAFAGVGGGITAVILMNAVRLYKGERFEIYTDGFYLRTTGQGNYIQRFLPLGQIERISRTQLGIYVSVGCEAFFFPMNEELWKYLEESYPELCKSEDREQTAGDGEQ